MLTETASPFSFMPSRGAYSAARTRHQLFGRNFDWQTCNAMVVTSEPSQGYASIPTVNLGFISQAGGSLNQNIVPFMGLLGPDTVFRSFCQIEVGHYRRFCDHHLIVDVLAYAHSPYYKNAFEAAGLTAETIKTAPLSPG